jgi:hypothetical protein
VHFGQVEHDYAGLALGRYRVTQSKSRLTAHNFALALNDSHLPDTVHTETHESSSRLLGLNLR